MRSFNRHLIEKALSRADAEDLLGKILFGEIRGKKEQDTKFEASISDLLLKFIGDNNHSPQVRDAFKFLSNNSKHFPEILHNTDHPLYRGVVVPLARLKKLKFRAGAGVPKGYVGAKFDYKAHDVLQSWTTERGVAWNFVLFGNADQRKETHVPKIHLEKTRNTLKHGPGRVNVVMIAKPNIKDDDTLFSAKFMNKIAMDELGNREFEVVRTTKKPIPVVAIIPAASWAVIQDYMGATPREKKLLAAGIPLPKKKKK